MHGENLKLFVSIFSFYRITNWNILLTLCILTEDMDVICIYPLCSELCVRNFKIESDSISSKMTIHAKPDMAKCFPTPHFHVW